MGRWFIVYSSSSQRLSMTITPPILTTLALAITLSTPRVSGHVLQQPLLRQETCPVVLKPDSPFARNSERYLLGNRINITNLLISTHVNSADGLSPRIVNGNNVLSDRLREMAVFLFTQQGDDNYIFCSGSLISATWVLSAAGCNILTTAKAIVGPRNVEVRPGTPPKLIVDGGEVIEVRLVMPHPDYNNGSGFAEANDIALVELERPASSRQFMRLNTRANIPERASFTRVMGYGSSVDGPEPLDTRNNLRQVDMPVFAFNECQDEFNTEIFAERQICVGYDVRECGVCFGDGGGPVFQYDENDNPVQVGLFSKLYGCGEEGKPSLHTRTDAFIEWMRENGAVFTAADNVRSVFSSDDGKPSIGVIAGSAIGAVVVVVLLISLICWIRRRKRNGNT